MMEPVTIMTAFFNLVFANLIFKISQKTYPLSRKYSNDNNGNLFESSVLQVFPFLNLNCSCISESSKSNPPVLMV